MIDTEIVGSWFESMLNARFEPTGNERTLVECWGPAGYQPCPGEECGHTSMRVEKQRQIRQVLPNGCESLYWETIN